MKSFVASLYCRSEITVDNVTTEFRYINAIRLIEF